MKVHSKSLVQRLRKSFNLEGDNLVRKYYAASNAWEGQVVKGSRHCKGYRVMGFENKTYFVHRIIFAVKHGFLPEQIDHINGDRSDNRLKNLRASDPQKNQENRRLSKRNRSGYRGVYFYDGKWRAQIRKKWKRYNLGSYVEKQDAVRAVERFVFT